MSALGVTAVYQDYKMIDALLKSMPIGHRPKHDCKSGPFGHHFVKKIPYVFFFPCIE